MNAKTIRGDDMLRYYAAIVESSDDAIIGKTLDGTIQSWNAGAQRIFGYTAEEVIGKSILILFPPDKVAEEADILQRIERGERIDHYETTRVRKDGSLVEISVTVSPVSDEDGRIVGASKIARDITVRKKAEEALIRAQSRYKRTLDHLLEGCQIIGFDWRYLYINDVAAAHGRMPRERLIGRTMMEAYPGIEKTKMFSNLKKCMEQGIPNVMENEFVFEDGKTSAWFNLRIEPVPEGIFILSVDITEEKMMLEELNRHRDHLEALVNERTAQLEEANKELESFSYSVSHDLRAPLRHINGFVSLLKNRIGSSLDAESERYLQTISASTVEMGTLIDSILDFSRMGRTALMVRKTNVGLLVRAVIDELSAEGDSSRIVWSIAPLPDVDADPGMLRLVFENLISNAMKFSSRKERPEICISCTRSDGAEVFVVKDNGVGFDMKYMDRLFGVFQRLHSQEEFEGVGIGLANVRRIVGRHGGRTWAEGKLNEGAAFYFSIPSKTMSKPA